MPKPKYRIEGGHPLHGKVRISGSKNHADYAIAAALLTADDVVLRNVPDIGDVRQMEEILEHLGGTVTHDGSIIRINCAGVRATAVPPSLAVTLRASFLAMGPLLARFGEAACPPPGGDAIGIQGTSKNIWIDHCEIFAENPDTQTNIDLYDGLIDIKNQTGFITISWSYFHDQHKGHLTGSSDTDIYADRKITWHHNYYNKVKLRVPMYRGAVGHFFNNYIVAARDASEIRADSCVRIEKNYYEPLNYSIYTSSDSPGQTQRIDNVEIMRASRAYPNDCTADIPYTYSNVLTNTTNDVKTLVPASAGVGKI